MLAFIDTETYEVRTAQTGPRQHKLTLVTGPADLAKKFTMPQLQEMALKLKGKAISPKVAKATVTPILWDSLVTQAQAIVDAVPEDMTGVATPHADAVPMPEVDEPPMTPRVVAMLREYDDLQGGISKEEHAEATSRSKVRPRLKAFNLHAVTVDLSTLPPQAAIIAQGLLKEAQAGVTRMDPDELEAFLVRLGLQTKQEPWRVFRYYHRNIELLGVISAVKEGDK